MAAVTVTSNHPCTAWLLTTALPNPADPAAPSVLDTFEMMQAIAGAGYQTDVTGFTDSTDETNPLFVVKILISKQGFPNQPGTAGQWVVFDGAYATVVDDATYQANYTQAGS